MMIHPRRLLFSLLIFIEICLLFLYSTRVHCIRYNIVFFIGFFISMFVEEEGESNAWEFEEGKRVGLQHVVDEKEDDVKIVR